MRDHSQSHTRDGYLYLCYPALNRNCNGCKTWTLLRVDHAAAWCAPMVVAKKQDSSLRICVDYTQLNPQLVPERIIMPTVEESLARLAGATVFSKLDANADYWQAPLAPESKELTTFITPVGRFQFKRLPFGIATAPEAFQREMLRILEGIPGQVCHMDDILVFSRDKREHNKNLELVLRRLHDSGVTLNTSKCEFSRKSIRFLGHLLDSRGIAADPKKTEAIVQMSAPGSLADLRSFLGMVNRLGKFLPDIAEKTKPLRDLLHEDASWLWSEPQEEAFLNIKDLLCKTPVLTLYKPDAQLTLSTDASSFAPGAVLLQEENGKRRPVVYASRATTQMEQRYAQVEKEALAIVWACEHFRTYLVGKGFHIETDHKPLVPLFTTKRLDEMTPRLQRLRMRIFEYDFAISHVPGKEMFTADVFSRKPLPTTRQSTDSRHTVEISETLVHEYEMLTVELLPASTSFLSRLKAELSKDPTTSRVMEYCEKQWPARNKLPPNLSKFASLAADLSVVQGLLMRNDRLVIPPSL